MKRESSDNVALVVSQKFYADLVCRVICSIMYCNEQNSFQATTTFL